MSLSLFPRRAFTLIEMMVAVVMVGMLATIAIPRLHPGAGALVSDAAAQLAGDLGLIRARALETGRLARVVFEPTGPAYVGYLDDDRDGVFRGDSAEVAALGAFGVRRLEGGVRFGPGDAPPLPADANAVLGAGRLEFDAYGRVAPAGARYVVYLSHRNDPGAVAAVEVSPDAGIQCWIYADGAWHPHPASLSEVAARDPARSAPRDLERSR